MLETVTSWIYPLRGIYYLATTPSLLQLVVRFLIGVTIASFISTVACFRLLWDPQLEFIGSVIGINLFSKATTAVLLLGEAAVPIYFIFNQRLKTLGERLFDKTLALKLGDSVIFQHGGGGAAGSTAAGGAQQLWAGRHPSLPPMQPQDHQALTRMVTMHRQKEEAEHKARNLIMAGVVMGFKLLFKPHINEGVAIRKGRDIATLLFTVLVPGAALLLPAFVYRDSTVEICDLMSRYWEAKGIKEADAQQLLVEHHMGELRGFGLVATGLSYIPVLNWALSLSNHVAAALFAAHVEARGGRLMKQWN